MSKSRNFTIFLLKDGFDAGNALKEEHGLELATAEARNLPNEATLYVLKNSPRPPWWKDYWGLQRSLEQSLQAAIVFLSVRNRTFAITFGHSYHKLKEESYEYDFGLKTTLNSVDPGKLRSTDIFQPEDAKRERIQTSKATDLNYFDISKDESIIKKITGIVKVDYFELFRNVTGSCNLKISSRIKASEIIELCGKLLNIYEKEDYLTSFSEINSIIPIKDPCIIHDLNGLLIDAFSSENIELVLSIPDIIDYTTSYKVKYTGAGKGQIEYEDVYIHHYREYLRYRNIEDITIDIFKKHELRIEDENNNILGSYSIFKSLLFDCEHNGKHFYLCEGEWYQIDHDYIEKLKTSLDPVFLDDFTLLSECSEIREDNYNNFIAANNENVICLDKKNISPSGQTFIEPCDLYYKKNGYAHLIHIKVSTRSASLSHLFNQGINSLELLKLNNESREKMRELISNDDLFGPMKEEKIKIIFGIITEKSATMRSDSLPIFSRISLLRTINRLKIMGVEGRVVLVKDKVNRKNIGNL